MDCSSPGICLILTIRGDIYPEEHMNTIPSSSKKPHQSSPKVTEKVFQVSSSITQNSTNHIYSRNASSLFSNPSRWEYRQGSVIHMLVEISLIQSLHLSKQLISARLGGRRDGACIIREENERRATLKVEVTGRMNMNRATSYLRAFNQEGEEVPL